MTSSDIISPTQQSPRKKRRWLRRLLWTAAVFVLLVATVMVVLQTDWAADKVRGIVETQVSATLRDGRLEIGRLDGNLFKSLRAADVRVYSRDSVVVSIDSLRAEYSLFSLLSGGFRVHDIELVRPAVTARQLPDSTWDLLNLAPVDTTQKQETDPFELRFDRARLLDGRIVARFHSGQTDSTIFVRDLQASLRDFYLEGDSFGSTIDEMRAQVSAPVAPDPVSLRMSGELGEDRVICATCILTSPRSKVTASGHLLFPETAVLRGDLRLDLDPLVLGDIAFALPGVKTDETVAGEVSLAGSTDSLSARVTLDFSSGAAAALSALIRTGDSARVQVEGDLTSFDPTVLNRNFQLAGSISAEIDVDLSGSSLETVSGPLTMRIFDTVLNRVELRDGYLRGQFERGTAQIESSLYLPGVALQANGTLTPFADTVAYDLSGSFRGRRVSEYYRAISGLDDLEGTFDIDGRGMTLEGARARASLSISKFTGLPVELGPSTLEAVLDTGDVALSAQVGLLGVDGVDAGSIRFDASIVDMEGAWRIDAGDLTISNLDIQTVAPEAPSGSISATGWLSASATTDSLLSAVGSLTVSGKIGAVEFSNSTVEVDYQAGTGSYAVDIESSVGGIESQGDFRSRADGYDITARGRVSGLNVDTLIAAKFATNLTGSIDATSFVGTNGLTSLSVETRLEESVVNDQRLEGGLITASLSDSVMSFDVEVDLPSGSLSGTGSFRPFDEVLTLHLPEASFSHINLAAWLDEESLTTDLNGIGSAELEGTNMSGDFRLSSSRINRASVTDGNISLTLADSTLQFEMDVNVDDGNLAATIAGRLGRRDTTYQGMFRLRDIDALGLAGVDTLESNLNAGCSFVGSNFSVPRLEASVLCTARNSRIGGARIDSLRFETTLDQDGLALDSLSIQSNIGRITGSGSIPARQENARSALEIDVQIEIADLSPAAKLVGATDLSGDGVVTLTVGGSVESPSFSTEASLEYLMYDAYRVSSLNGFVVMPDFEAGHLVGAIDVGFSVFNDVPIRSMSIELERSDNVFLLTADTRIDARRNGRISARYEERGQLDHFVVDELHLNLDGEIWRLSEEASVEISDRWSVQTFLLFSDGQQIAIDGHIDPDGEQNLILTLDQTRLGAFTDLIGYPGVDGIGEGYIVLTGPSDNLEMEISARVQSLQTYGRDVGNFVLSAAYADGQMDIDGRLSHSSGATLTADGFVPMRLTMTGFQELTGNEPVQVEVKSDSIPLAWIRPFLDQTVIDRIEGYLVSDVQIGGTWDDPGLSGSATVTEGRARLPEFKLDMRSIFGSFRLDGNQLIVENVSALSEGGELTADGSLGFRSLDDPTFDLDAKFNDFRAISTETYQVTVSGKGRLTGSMINPVFSGDVTMQESDIFMTEELMADEVDPVRLTERDLLILERRFGYRVASGDTTQWSFYEALDLNLEVDIGRDVWFRSYSDPRMDIEFSGDLSVTKEPHAEEIVSGTVNVNPARSRVISFARRFEITTGEIQFNGLIQDALVDLRAQYSVPSRFGGDEVKILLDITGTVGDLRLDLSSEPPMDTGAMVSYLTTGRPPGEASVGGTQAAELAVSRLSSLVEGFGGTELGLDVVEIQMNPTRGTSITVGKYVSPKIYVSLTQPLVANNSYESGDTAHQTEMAIEYELVSWLIAQLASSRNQLEVNMIWKFAF